MIKKKEKDISSNCGVCKSLDTLPTMMRMIKIHCIGRKWSKRGDIISKAFIKSYYYIQKNMVFFFHLSLSVYMHN